MIDYERIIEDIQRETRENLSEKRLRHTENVLEKALELAEEHDMDEEDKLKLTIAALGHDIFRNTREDGNALSHGPTASSYMKDKYNIEDEDILNSLRYHTTGRPAMSLMEKIIFLADAIEKDREYDGVDDIREAAEKGLDQGVRTSLMNTVEHLVLNNRTIDEDTLDALNYYKKEE